jgi:hypothetical protein
VIRLSNGESFLWFYGQIVYDDISGKANETAFCWCYYDGDKSFTEYGPEVQLLDMSPSKPPSAYAAACSDDVTLARKKHCRPLHGRHR